MYQNDGTKLGGGIGVAGTDGHWAIARIPSYRNIRDGYGWPWFPITLLGYP